MGFSAHWLGFVWSHWVGLDINKTENEIVYN
jgi:hypothetical protein